MYRKVLNYLRGQVTVEVESAAPERVLNLCAAHGIPFWELEWLSEIRLRAVTSRAALPRLQTALAQTDAAVTVLRRQGAPEVWRQYRRRYVLWAAAGLLLAAVLIVWQARALSRRELVCRFCGKQLRLPWNRLLLRQHVGNEWWLFCPTCGRKTWFTARKRGE